MAGEELSATTGEALIAIQSALLREQPYAQIAQFELYLRLARSERGPQPWTRPYLDVARQVLTRLGSPDPEYYAQTLNALVNGMALVRLTAPEPGVRRARAGARDTRMGARGLQRRTMTWRA